MRRSRATFSFLFEFLKLLFKAECPMASRCSWIAAARSRGITYHTVVDYTPIGILCVFLAQLRRLRWCCLPRTGQNQSMNVLRRAFALPMNRLDSGRGSTQKSLALEARGSTSSACGGLPLTLIPFSLEDHGIIHTLLVSRKLRSTRNEKISPPRRFVSVVLMTSEQQRITFPVMLENETLPGWKMSIDRREEKDGGRGGIVGCMETCQGFDAC
jgi:hypothetical protein